MRLLHFFIVLFFLLSCTSKKEPKVISNSATTFNESKEQEAIMDLIEKETDCFFKRNYDCWKICFAQTPYSFQAWNNGDGSVDTKSGWKEVNEKIKAYLTVPGNQPKQQSMGQERNKEEVPSSHPKVIRKHIVWKFFTPELAYLMWDQYNSEPDEKRYTFSKECRIMEKINNEWKIVNVSSYWDYKNLYNDESIK